MIQYDTLYTRDSSGNIRIWYMEVSGSKYRTVSGLSDGKLVVSDWKEAKEKNIGKKNATTGEEQAVVEVTAKYKKQLKTGYSTNIHQVGIMSYVEPMLAKKYVDYEHKIKFDGNWGVQSKLNGCVSGDSLIKTKEFGYKAIKWIVENRVDCLVLSYNTQSKKQEYKKILNYFKDKESTENVVWYEIELESGEKIKITGNHLVYLPDLSCWRRVDELNGNENLMVIK